jgi:hypothetical protein
MTSTCSCKQGTNSYNILHYCHEQGHFVRLTIAVQDVIDYGFLWFPKLHQCNEDVAQCRRDFLGLFGFNL